MPVTLTLAPAEEARLRESIARRDVDTVRRVLLDAIEPTVNTLLAQDIWQGYDPEQVQATLVTTGGSWADLDIDHMLTNLYKNRIANTRFRYPSSGL